MYNGLKERSFSYFSGIFNPIYEQYKLKSDSQYARQRFSSLQTLLENSIQPLLTDYELYRCGILSDDAPLEQMIETVIDAKNSYHNNSFSVGDVIKVFHVTNRYLYYVDPVGLKQLSVF
jgi:hypothetical protein